VNRAIVPSRLRLPYNTAPSTRQARRAPAPGPAAAPARQGYLSSAPQYSCLRRAAQQPPLGPSNIVQPLPVVQKYMMRPCKPCPHAPPCPPPCKPCKPRPPARAKPQPGGLCPAGPGELWYISTKATPRQLAKKPGRRIPAPLCGSQRARAASDPRSRAAPGAPGPGSLLRLVGGPGGGQVLAAHELQQLAPQRHRQLQALLEDERARAGGGVPAGRGAGAGGRGGCITAGAGWARPGKRAHARGRPATQAGQPPTPTPPPQPRPPQPPTTRRRRPPAAAARPPTPPRPRRT
jgi:hypothetical protein